MPDIHPDLAALCDQLDQLPQNELADRLCTAILEHDGEYVLPSLDTRPGRECYEFSVFGITAAGGTQRAAAETWRCTARTAIGGYNDPAPRGAFMLLQAQLRWIRSVVMIRMTPDQRRSWARLVLAISDDHAMRRSADAILRADTVAVATAAE